jgi:hypothetical protein
LVSRSFIFTPLDRRQDVLQNHLDMKENKIDIPSIKKQEFPVIRPAGCRLSRFKLFNPYPANVENMLSS